MKNFKDIMLDIVGWGMIGLANYKFFFTEASMEIIPYIAICVLGVIFVAFRIKKIAAKGWNVANKFIKKKLG